MSDDVPYHLRLDAPPLAICNRCGRNTWDVVDVGVEDRMTQPDGNPCGGRFVTNNRSAEALDAYYDWLDRHEDH